MQTIFPIIRYTDARTAIAFLCKSFGFSEVFSMPSEGPTVRHAQLRLGDNIIMVGTTREGDGIVSPKSAGISTQALCVYVEDVERHYQNSVLTGAEIVSGLTYTDFGAREYHVRDVEGHQWTFGTFRPSLG